jgi:hypothetical protein
MNILQAFLLAVGIVILYLILMHFVAKHDSSIDRSTKDYDKELVDYEK